MAKLTDQQKYENQLNRALQRALKNNQKEKYPISLDVLAHNLWNDYPKFRDEKMNTDCDKIRIRNLLNHAENVIFNL